ncbi:MAG: UvrD-helicase domain-containing protein [Acidimicrobiales bacterium]
MTVQPLPLIDEQVRKRVRRDGLGETLFVEAGAGSGKTTLLVDRIVNLVLRAGVPLSAIAAITFTEAAASELQSRIRAKFEHVQAHAIEAGDHDRAARCRQAVADSDLAAITTLHGFANRILGEFAVGAGLPPQIRVLDEVSSQLAQEDRWQRFVDRLYDSDEHVELLQAASALKIPVEPRYTDQPTMRTVASQFNQNWDRLGSLINTELSPLGGDYDFSQFDSLVDELAEARNLNKLTDDKLYVKLQALLPEMQTIAAIPEPLRKMRALTEASHWGPGSGGKGESWDGADTVVFIKDMIKAVEVAKDEVLRPIFNDVLLRLSQVIATETFAAAQARRSDGGLEFYDLLVLSRDLLRTSPYARQVLHDRFRHLLLDEFQDTDPIQIELAVLIATSASDVAGLSWSDMPVDPGRLFFVGDPKQSIYRFRRADIALFLRARDRFAGPQGSVQLETNFRTVEPIVTWVNALFDTKMPEEQVGAQPKYQPLVASRRAETAERSPLHRPVLFGGPNENAKIRSTELRSIEADDVVGMVRAIMADPENWRVFDQRLATWRAASLDDITILLPTRTSLPFLRSALDDAELRYRIVTGTLVYDTQEVVDTLAALRAIDDPGDELSLITALRSPMYACSDVDLVIWRRNGGRWDVRAPIPETVAASHPVAVAVTHLHGLWRERWFLTPSMLLERLLRERRATLLAFGDPRTTDVWRRLRFLVDQARTFEESNSGDLRAFTQWAALQSGSMARVHEPLLPETDGTALSIQTIHGSKGLEFPITILSGMTTQFRGARPGVSVLWPEDGPPSVRMKKGVETHEHGPLADLETAMDDYEKIRLAYVATTRARDHLIVSCHHKAGSTASKTYGGLFWQVFETDEHRSLARQFDWREVVGSQQLEPLRPAPVGLVVDNRKEWIAERAALLAPYRVPRVLSATGVARAALALAPHALTAPPVTVDDDNEVDRGEVDRGIDRESELDIDQATAGETSTSESVDGLAAYALEQLVDQDDDGADQPEQGLIGRRRGRTGSAIGSAVHAVLQLIELAKPDGVGDVVAQQCEIEGIADRTGIVRRLVQAALESSAVALAATHPHFKELFVTAPLGDRTIEGYVDLLVETPEGLIVVDYKTDSVRSNDDVDAKLGAYELQAAAYAVALEEVTGQNVIDCRFVFCTATGAIERSVVDLPRAKDRVRATVNQLARLSKPQLR